MTIQELYLESRQEDFLTVVSLSYLIELLVMKLKVLTFSDNEEDLKLYISKCDTEKVNKLLLEYQSEKGYK